MKLAVFPSSIETSRALILRLVELMNEEPDRIFNIAVSGGNTPALMFDLWANEYLDITPWNRMKIYWVDERCVPPEDSDSNYGMMRNLLLGIAPIPYENVFRIRGEAKPVKEAVRYSELVNSNCHTDWVGLSLTLCCLERETTGILPLFFQDRRIF